MLRRLLLLLPVLVCAGVVTASAATVRVKADRTPMRSSASASASVVLELKAGTLLDLVDVDRDWYKVRDPQSQKEGFVLVASVDLLPGTPAQVSGQKPAMPGSKPAAGSKPAVAARPPKKGEWVDLGYLSINGFYQGGSAFTQSQSWPSFAETASVSIDYPAKSAGGVDVEGGFRIWRNLAVGIGITHVSRAMTTEVSGSLPNPIYLNRPIALSGGFDASNTESAVHVQAAWVVPMPPKMQLVLFGGPSIFKVTQTIVEAQGIGLPAGYPFDSGAISTAKTTDGSKTAVGFGAGVDVAYFFTRTVGVGGIVRFAKATASFPVTGQAAVEADAGGFQAGAGLRIRIPSARSPRRAPKPPAPKTPSKPTSGTPTRK